MEAKNPSALRISIYYTILSLLCFFLFFPLIMNIAIKTKNKGTYSKRASRNESKRDESNIYHTKWHWNEWKTNPFSIQVVTNPFRDCQRGSKVTFTINRGGRGMWKEQNRRKERERWAFAQWEEISPGTQIINVV